MSLVRILHISDLHISRRPDLIGILDYLKIPPGQRPPFPWSQLSTYSHAILSHLTQLIHDQCSTTAARLGRTVDAVLLTGDIATTGLSGDLHKALQFIEGPPGPISLLTVTGMPTLGAIRSVPIFLLPGNHDRYDTDGLLSYTPGNLLFYSVFGKYWRREAQDFGTLRNGNVFVSILGADFSLRTELDTHGIIPGSKFGQGRVYHTILRRLVELTNRATTSISNHMDASSRHVIIWALHYPPDYSGVHPTMKLIDEDLLIQDANRSRVSAILSGHTHESRRYQQANMNFEVFCEGTSAQLFTQHGHSAHILEISPNNINWRPYEFNPIQSRFAPVP